MKLETFLNERDIALNKVETCKEFKGKDKIDCKIEKYQDYIRDIEDAIKTSTSDDEEKDLERSLEFAKGVLFKLRSRKK